MRLVIQCYKGNNTQTIQLHEVKINDVESTSGGAGRSSGDEGEIEEGSLQVNLACMTMGRWRRHSTEREHEGMCQGEKTSKSCALDTSECRILGDQACGRHRISQNCSDSPYGHYSVTLLISFDTNYTKIRSNQACLRGLIGDDRGSSSFHVHSPPLPPQPSIL